jgi:hypothetical protein
MSRKLLQENEQQKKAKIQKLKGLSAFLDDENFHSLDKFLSLDDYKKNIQEDIEVLENDEIRLIVCGTFGSGKTTFINSLLEIDYLPTQTGENSSCVVYLRNAQSDDEHNTSEVKLHFEETRIVSLNAEQTEKDIRLFLEKQSSIKPETDLENDIVAQRLSKYLNESEIELIKKNGYDPSINVRSVQVKIKNPLLSRGVTLVDSPGTGSITQIHESIAIHEIERSSAFIYLFNSRSPGKKADYSFVRRFWSEKEKAILILNKADEIYADHGFSGSIEDVIGHLKNNFPEDLKFNDGTPPFLPLSVSLHKGENQYIKLSERYCDKNINELSNYDRVLQEIETVVNKVDSNAAIKNVEPEKYINSLKAELFKIKDEFGKPIDNDRLNENKNRFKRKIQRYEDYLTKVDDIVKKINKENWRNNDQIKNIGSKYKNYCDERLEIIKHYSFDNFFDDNGRVVNLKELQEIDRYYNDQQENIIGYIIGEFRNRLSVIDNQDKLNDGDILQDTKDFENIFEDIGKNVAEVAIIMNETEEINKEIKKNNEESEKLKNSLNKAEARIKIEIEQLNRENKSYDTEKKLYEKDLESLRKRKEKLGPAPEIKITVIKKSKRHHRTLWIDDVVMEDELVKDREDLDDYDKREKKIEKRIEEQTSKVKSYYSLKRKIEKKISEKKLSIDGKEDQFQKIKDLIRNLEGKKERKISDKESLEKKRKDTIRRNVGKSMDKLNDFAKPHTIITIVNSITEPIKKYLNDQITECNSNIHLIESRMEKSQESKNIVIRSIEDLNEKITLLSNSSRV